MVVLVNVAAIPAVEMYRCCCCCCGGGLLLVRFKADVEAGATFGGNAISPQTLAAAGTVAFNVGGNRASCCDGDGSMGVLLRYCTTVTVKPG
jgi:hypothetical protein